MQADVCRARYKPHVLAAILTLISIGLFLLSSTQSASAESANTQSANTGQFVTINSQVVDASKLDSSLLQAISSGRRREYEVIVVYNDPSVISRLAPLTSVLYKLQVLPVTGLIFSSSEIGEVSTWPEIDSITLNRRLNYFSHESARLIGADQVWNSYNQRGGDNNVRVAVIDSGIDGLHPDLAYGSRVVQNVVMTPFAVGVENVPTTDTVSGHGTHVAGTIGADGTVSNDYYQGIAPAVDLIGLSSGASITLLTALQSYDWVLEHHEEYNIRIVNSSWGLSGGGDLNVNDPLVMATYEAYKAGILSIFPAGNGSANNTMNPYSLAPWVLSVAAGDKNGKLAGFSSRGQNGDEFKHPDLTAPGVNIYSTRAIIPGITVADLTPNPVNPAWTLYYTKMSGTSMAVPHVSGAAALLLSENSQLSPDQLMDLLTTTTTPMPGTALYQAGTGYLDALAAFEASLNVSGNLSAFLNGQIAHPIEEVIDEEAESLEYATAEYSGYVPAGALSLPNIDYPVAVNNNVAYIHAALSWTPEVQDAFDLYILDPNDNIIASSVNTFNLTESALAIPAGTGSYKVRVAPFLANNVHYTLTITTAYGNSGAAPSAPQFDYRFNVTGVTKSLVGVNLAADYFRGGDSGTVAFTFNRTNGASGAGMRNSLQAMYVDRLGNTFVDNALTDKNNGKYESRFQLNNSWSLAPGPIDVYLIYTGSGTVEPLAPARFYANYLVTSLTTNATRYKPGNTITFSGTVKEANTIAGTPIQTLAVRANVTVKLVNNEGTVLASKAVQANLVGKYNGSLVAPAGTHGKTTLVAEATYNDPLILVGPRDWYGNATKTLSFPGNLAPEATVTAAVGTNPNNSQFISIYAEVTDIDGRNDVDAMTVSVTDGAGHALQGWQTDDFDATNNAWTLSGSRPISGATPWTVTLTATDSAGNVATSSQVIH